MTIDVNLLAGYRIIAGKSHLTLEMTGGHTVQDALLLVIKRCPGLKPHWLDKKGNRSPLLHVFVNGDEVTALEQGFNTILSDGDTLEFIPPLSGG